MRRFLTLTIVAALLPTTAQAHLTSTGLGPAYDGLLHFFTSPADLAAVIALALFAGLRGADHARRIVFALPCAWLLGSLIGLTNATPASGELVSASWLVGIGVLAAADVALPRAATTAVALLLGAMLGYSNGTGMPLSVSVLIALAGLAAAVFVTAALVAALVIRFGTAWRRIGVRIAGSWIAASGLLLFGWVIRGG
jgi:hydrogenase/urease accessory protein HupE